MAASINAGMIIFLIFTFVTFIVSGSLLSKSIYSYCKQKHQVSKPNKKPLGLTLICMFLFTMSLFMYSVHFIVFAASGAEIPGFNLFNNILYVIALFITLFVWIQRLDVTFHNSAHGYSVKYIRNLRIFYFITLGFMVILILQHIVVYALDLTRIGTYLGGAVFILLFITLFTIVLYSFLNKMRQSVKLSQKVEKTVAHETAHIGKRLVALMVKFTILSVLCIGSTFIALVTIVILQVLLPDYNWCVLQLPFALDQFIGFITLFCTWSVNKKVYYKLFGCVHHVIIKYREESSTHGGSIHDVEDPPEPTETPQTAPQLFSVESQTGTAAAAENGNISMPQ